MGVFLSLLQTGMSVFGVVIGVKMVMDWIRGKDGSVGDGGDDVLSFSRLFVDEEDILSDDEEELTDEENRLLYQQFVKSLTTSGSGVTSGQESESKDSLMDESSDEYHLLLDHEICPMHHHVEFENNVLSVWSSHPQCR